MFPSFRLAVFMPRRMEPYGQIDLPTLKVPFFMAAVDLLVLWSDLKDDCRAAASGREYRLCQGTLQRLADHQAPLREQDFPEPGFIFGARAMMLRKAFLASRNYDEIANLSGLPNLGGVPADMVPADLRDRLAVEHGRVLKFSATARDLQKQQKDEEARQ